MLPRTILSATLVTLLLAAPAFAAPPRTVEGRKLQQDPTGWTHLKFPRMRAGQQVILGVTTKDMNPGFRVKVTLDHNGTYVFNPRDLLGGTVRHSFVEREIRFTATTIPRADKAALDVPIKHRQGPPALVASPTLKAMTQRLLAWNGGFTGKGMKLTERKTLSAASFVTLDGALQTSLQTAFTQRSKGKGGTLEAALRNNEVTLQEVMWTAQGERGIAYRIANKKTSTFAGVSLGLPEARGSDLSFGLPMP
jgi:hypothetical protein